jgi:endonuclease/exonuclease/phosphatase family metal-dependent hydrolase
MEAQPEPSPPAWPRAALLGATALVAGFVIYRVAAVYTVRTRCGDPAGEPVRAIQVAAAAPAVEPAVDRRAAGATVASAGSAPPLRVVTWNVEGHAALWRRDHLDRVAEAIRRLDPDVVALQEMHRGTWQARSRDQVAELAAATGLAAWFGPSFETLGGEFGNALLTRGEVVSARVVPLPGVGEPRSVLAVRLRIGGREVSVLATHLTAWGPLRRSVRMEQIGCLAEAIRRAEPPVVVAGDLNAGPATPELERLTGAVPLAPCGGALDQPTHRRTGARLDHLLCGPGWGPATTRVEPIGPADHWPLVAEIEWPQPAGASPGG